MSPINFVTRHSSLHSHHCSFLHTSLLPSSHHQHLCIILSCMYFFPCPFISQFFFASYSSIFSGIIYSLYLVFSLFSFVHHSLNALNRFTSFPKLCCSSPPFSSSTILFFSLCIVALVVPFFNLF